MSSSEKYIAFRNYMTHELKITREDIEEWTKEAVSAQVQKFLERNMDSATITKTINDMIGKAISAEVRKVVYGESSFGSSNALRDELAKAIMKRLTISVAYNPETK